MDKGAFFRKDCTGKQFTEVQHEDILKGAEFEPQAHAWQKKSTDHYLTDCYVERDADLKDIFAIELDEDGKSGRKCTIEEVYDQCDDDIHTPAWLKASASKCILQRLNDGARDTTKRQSREDYTKAVKEKVNVQMRFLLKRNDKNKLVIDGVAFLITKPTTAGEQAFTYYGFDYWYKVLTPEATDAELALRVPSGFKMVLLPAKGGAASDFSPELKLFKTVCDQVLEGMRGGGNSREMIHMNAGNWSLLLIDTVNDAFVSGANFRLERVEDSTVLTVLLMATNPRSLYNGQGHATRVVNCLKEMLLRAANGGFAYLLTEAEDSSAATNFWTTKAGVKADPLAQSLLKRLQQMAPVGFHPETMHGATPMVVEVTPGCLPDVQASKRTTPVIGYSMVDRYRLYLKKENGRDKKLTEDEWGKVGDGLFTVFGEPANHLSDPIAEMEIKEAPDDNSFDIDKHYATLSFETERHAFIEGRDVMKLKCVGNSVQRVDSDGTQSILDVIVRNEKRYAFASDEACPFANMEDAAYDRKCYLEMNDAKAETHYLSRVHLNNTELIPELKKDGFAYTIQGVRAYTLSDIGARGEKTCTRGWPFWKEVRAKEPRTRDSPDDGKGPDGGGDKPDGGGSSDDSSTNSDTDQPPGRDSPGSEGDPDAPRDGENGGENGEQDGTQGGAKEVGGGEAAAGEGEAGGENGVQADGENGAQGMQEDAPTEQSSPRIGSPQTTAKSPSPALTEASTAMEGDPMQIETTLAPTPTTGSGSASPDRSSTADSPASHERCRSPTRTDMTRSRDSSSSKRKLPKGFEMPRMTARYSKAEQKELEAIVRGRKRPRSKTPDKFKELTSQQAASMLLFDAALRGSKPLVLACLQVGADAKPFDASGRTALIAACREGHLEIVELLLAQDDVNINHDDADGTTALIAASYAGSIEIMELLLAQDDVNINHDAADGTTALIAASYAGSIEIMELLLAKDGAVAINATSKGHTALMVAAEQGHAEVVKVLLAQDGLRVNATDNSGFTAFMGACQRGYANIVKLFLERDDVKIDHASSKQGATALMKAGEKGHTDIVKLILEKGVNQKEINRVDNKFGASTLMVASMEGHTDIVRLLLEKGADPFIHSVEGCTARVVALEKGHADVYRLLVAEEVAIAKQHRDSDEVERAAAPSAEPAVEPPAATPTDETPTVIDPPAEAPSTEPPAASAAAASLVDGTPAAASDLAGDQSATIGNGVEVQPSAIEGAGDGLFTSLRFKVGDDITEYSGARLTSESGARDSTVRRIVGHADKYVAAGCLVQTHIARHDPDDLGNPIYIDGDREPQPGRGGGPFANHSDSPNAELVAVGERLFLRAIKPIEPASGGKVEIFINYGLGKAVAFGERRHVQTTNTDGCRTVETKPVPWGDLYTSGFNVFHVGVSEEEAAKVRAVKCEEELPNDEDEHGQTSPGDRTRLQSAANPKEAKPLVERSLNLLREKEVLRCSKSHCSADAPCLMRKDKSCCKYHANTRVLKSIPLPSGKPGAEQPNHADGAPAESLRRRKVEDVMLSAILAVEESSLRIKPFGQDWQTVKLSRGDLLVFRGDVCHHGMGYDKVNVRVHFFIDSPVIPRVPNRTFPGCG